ncbi:nitroreductase family protein [Candidatus Electronema sp. JM]|uniref:nitroreductase family protein n=1 Tax=Candidatus Electronema sp. JM TaxID=3401571 RepID=UPI003AA96635
MSDIEQISSLEHIIRARRSIRSFSGQVSDETLRKIVESALYAPYAAGTGIPFKEIRRIFIFRQQTAAMTQAQEIIQEHLRRSAFKLRLAAVFSKKMRTLAGRVQASAEKGIPSLCEGSLIVAAEQKGFPAVEAQSLAHVMQNMWLTAAAHGVGLQLLSLTGGLANNKQFMQLLGLPPNKWALSGCVVGIPKHVPAAREQRNADDFIFWLK